MMMHVTNEVIKFLIRSFKPNYIIHLTTKNKIINFDEQLIQDFNMCITDSDDFVGINIIELLSQDKKYSPEFAKTLGTLIHDCSTGLCAINTSFKDGIVSEIPGIYILLVTVELKIVGGNKVKEIKIFNYIEIARFLSSLFSNSMSTPFLTLSKMFKDYVRKKSLFFAFESLKCFGTFISSETAKKTNQYQLADVVFPFHKGKTTELTTRFVNEFLRSTGYIEYDKSRKIKELSLEALKRITNKHLIPFNSLDRNCIIRLT